MKKNLFVYFLLCVSITVMAQHHKTPIPTTAIKDGKMAKKSAIFHQTSKGIVRIQPNLPAWQPRLVHHSVSHKALTEEQDKQFLLRQSEKMQRKAAQVAQRTPSAELVSAEPSTLTASFEGNETTNWYPPDDHIAISNNGIIVGVINSQISYFDTDGNLLDGTTFDNLFSDFELSADLFDPRVVYDPSADRFIMLILNDRSPQNSKILLCFSVSNNPLDGWYLYELDGNPLDNGTWFDYPSVGFSQNELYISGNSYNTGFDQALLYQITKADGYEGNEISFQYWYDIQGSPSTLVPLSAGQSDQYGPGCYLIATSSTTSGNSVKFYDLTDDLDGNPEILYYNVTIDTYESGTPAYQKDSNKKLRTAGTVIRSAFYLNGVVHYAFAKDRDSGSSDAAGWNGICYNRLRLSDLNNTAYTLSGGDVDLCYAAIASSGTDENNQAITMVCLASSENVYPEMRTIQFDHNMTPTTLQTVRVGNGAITVGCDANCRWGDYTGIQRKYNTATETWMMGQVARANGNWRNWIAGSLADPVGIAPASNMLLSDLSLYPNPSYDGFYIRFALPTDTDINIHLYNLLGQSVHQLYSGRALAGDNTFSFNRKTLPAGIYLLQLNDAKGNPMAHYKVMVE